MDKREKVHEELIKKCLPIMDAYKDDLIIHDKNAQAG